MSEAMIRRIEQSLASTSEADVLDLKSASKYLKVHPNTLYRLTHLGEVPAKKLGKIWRFYKPSLDRWLKDPSNA